MSLAFNVEIQMHLKESSLKFRSVCSQMYSWMLWESSKSESGCRLIWCMITREWDSVWQCAHYHFTPWLEICERTCSCAHGLGWCKVVQAGAMHGLWHSTLTAHHTLLGWRDEVGTRQEMCSRESRIWREMAIMQSQQKQGRWEGKSEITEDLT